MKSKHFLRIVAFTITAMMLLSFTFSALAYSTIPYGENSDDVRTMQLALKEQKHYTGSVDGKFGPATKKAVLKFQTSVGLKADGKPGNKTLSALYEGKSAVNKTNNKEAWTSAKPSDPDTLYYGQTGSRVKELQRALKDVGCYNGSIDGVYGDLTYAAVKAFQYKCSLKADGMVGKKTLAALNKKSTKNVSSSFILSNGSRGAEVKKLQVYLRDKGYTFTDAITMFGQSTEDALKQWQTDTGRSVTGTFSESDYNDIFIKKTN